MENTLRSELSLLPIRRLTTVLRVNLELLTKEDAFSEAANLITNWWNRKAEPYGTQIISDSDDLSFAKGRFRIEFARASDLFAMAMEEPDSDPLLERDWICDFGLRRVDDRTLFEIRVSYRQPHNAGGRPEPRAPTLLRELLIRIGAIDLQPMQVHAKFVEPNKVQGLADLLFSPNRKLPIVAVSEESSSGPIIEPNLLAKFLAGTAHVFHLNSEASWSLSHLVGPEKSVFQGAVRCYNPQMQWADDKFRHKLWLAKDIRRANAANRNGFLNVCAVQVFTQVTAQFEALPFLSPAAVRRQTVLMQQTGTEDPQLRPPESSAIAAQPSLHIPSLSHSPSEWDHSDRRDQNSLLNENQELKSALGALAVRLAKQEEAALVRERQASDMEAQLEQERAGRAEDASLHQDTKDNLWLNEQEVKELRERDALLKGGSAETSEALRPLWQNMSQLFQAMQHIATEFRRLEDDSAKLNGLTEKVAELNEHNAKLQAKLESLNLIPNLSGAGTETVYVAKDEMLSIVSQLVRRPTLESVLKCLELAYPDRCTILESAVSSAVDSSEFRYVPKAYDLLCKLVTEYWDSMAKGRGDVIARTTLGEAYAAKESERLSKGGLARRTFNWQDRSILMEKHLKIGTADNATDTLRVHFEWVSDQRRIVIGHCGRHLAF